MCVALLALPSCVGRRVINRTCSFAQRHDLDQPAALLTKVVVCFLGASVVIGGNLKLKGGDSRKAKGTDVRSGSWQEVHKS